MEKITKYKAFDGSIFDTEKDCLKYETLLAKVEEIMKPFGKRPDDCNFTNGGGYIQHDVEAVSKAKKEITKLGNTIFMVDVSFEWIGRYVDGSGNKCLYHAWTRLSCMSSNGKEYGQPYYVLNPAEAKQIPYKTK